MAVCIWRMNNAMYQDTSNKGQYTLINKIKKIKFKKDWNTLEI